MSGVAIRILAGVALVAALVAWGLFERSGRLESKAEAATLRDANAANLATIERMESDAIINEAKAIADALERRALEEDSRERNQAIDAVAENGCSDPAMDALLERRRLQRSRDRDRDKTGRP